MIYLDKCGHHTDRQACIDGHGMPMYPDYSVR